MFFLSSPIISDQVLVFVFRVYLYLFSVFHHIRLLLCKFLLFYVYMIISLCLQANFTFFRVSPFLFCLHRLPFMFFLSSPIIFDQVLVLFFMVYLYLFLFSIIFDHYFLSFCCFISYSTTT